MNPPGEMCSFAAGNCALVIPPLESADKGLKLSALGYYETGQKDFLGSDMMIPREPQMCPFQLSHPQRLENAPQMISPSEFDEKLGNRCALPSSQLGQKGISGFSLDGTSRLTKPP
jgi:hypothetical protein